MNTAGPTPGIFGSRGFFCWRIGNKFANKIDSTTHARSACGHFDWLVSHVTLHIGNMPWYTGYKKDSREEGDRVGDRSGELLSLLGRIRDRCQQVQGPLLEWRLLSNDRPDALVAFPLLDMIQDADDLLQMVIPDRHPGEILGFPPEWIGRRPREIHAAHENHVGWDFGAWLAEKITHLKRSVKSLVRYYRMSPSQVASEGVDSQSVDEYLHSTVNHLLGAVEHYAQVIYDQVYQNQLRVRDD